MSTAEIPQFDIAPPSEFDVPGTDIHVRLFNEGDTDKLLRLAQEDAVQKYIPWAKRVHDHTSAADTITSFESAWDKRVRARYAIEQDGTFAGYCGIWSDQTPECYEFGFAMLPEFRGRGIGTTTITELMGFAKNDMNAAGMVAYVHDTNDASKAVVIKLGFQPTNEFDDGDRRYTLNFG